MATTTTNLGLILPIGTENVSRQIINNNMQAIDDKFGNVDAAVGRNKLRSLLTKTTITSSYSTYNTYDGRKISDFKLIAIVAYRGNWSMGSLIIPKQNFVNATGALIMSAWNGTSIEFDIKYNSDTSFQAKYISTDTGTMRIEVLGMSFT